MADETTRDHVIEHAARMMHRALNPMAPEFPTQAEADADAAQTDDGRGLVPGDLLAMRTDYLRHAQALEAYGLLVDPGVDQSASWVLDRVRVALGTPEGRAVSIHAAEVAAELEQLRTRLAAQENINQAWQEYKLRKQAERERNITAFEVALGLEHAGRGFWYERMIEAAAHVRAERDDARAKLDQMRAEIRSVLADFRHCGPRLSVTMLQQINDIVEREPTTRCVNDTNGDGDCAACARNPDALCRQPTPCVEAQP
jgi:hypothetical protein